MGGLAVPEGKPLPAPIQNEVDFAMDWILGLEFSETSPLHKEFFGNDYQGRFFQEFLGRIEAFNYRVVNNNSTVAVVSSGKPVVHITQNFITRNDFDWVDNAAIIIHEVRHIFVGEGRFSHVKCPELDFEGTPLIGHMSGESLFNQRACDGHHRGAYGHQVVMLANVANFCTNCTAGERIRARYLAGQLIRRIVNNPGAYRKIKKDSQL